MKYKITPSLKNKLKKLYKKERKRYNILTKKMEEIIFSENIGNYKNLKKTNARI